MQLSIILPCYNPLPGWHEHIITSIEKIRKEIAGVELILVNDGSPVDLSRDIAVLKKEIPGLKYIHYHENKGKGNAIRTGLSKAEGRYIIYTDIDFPYTHESFMRIYETLISDKCDIAVGVKDDLYYEHVPLLRKWTSKTLRFMTSRLLRISITDTQCGLKGLNQHAARILEQGQINRYLFDLEMIYNAERMHQRLLPVPVSLREGVSFSKVKMKILVREFTNFMTIISQKRS
ncbi:glycosyltransferase family 2 protein [Taibaiella soli]|uniref:glycosyltransferase family 2 protein n=1 Tax=Taibaiella soli TaxID=1649169 RepID=UPI0014032DC6|nr:glycosyltransferase family 2 protein [Taibaiella soli]